jgi:hypothetical protein
MPLRLATGGVAMSFGLYAIGFAILIGGLIYAAHLVHMPAHWIVGRDRTLRRWDSVGRKGDAPERSCGITVLRNLLTHGKEFAR